MNLDIFLNHYKVLRFCFAFGVLIACLMIWSYLEEQGAIFLIFESFQDLSNLSTLAIVGTIFTFFIYSSFFLPSYIFLLILSIIRTWPRPYDCRPRYLSHIVCIYVIFSGVLIYFSGLFSSQENSTFFQYVCLLLAEFALFFFLCFQQFKLKICFFGKKSINLKLIISIVFGLFFSKILSYVPLFLAIKFIFYRASPEVLFNSAYQFLLITFTFPISMIPALFILYEWSRREALFEKQIFYSFLSTSLFVSMLVLYFSSAPAFVRDLILEKLNIISAPSVEEVLTISADALGLDDWLNKSEKKNDYEISRDHKSIKIKANVRYSFGSSMLLCLENNCLPVNRDNVVRYPTP